MRRSQDEPPAPPLLLPLELASPIVMPPLDQPLLEPEALLVIGQPAEEEVPVLEPNPGGARPAPDLPQRS